MDLEPVRACPVCESTRRQVLYSDLTDRTFGIAPGRWTLRQCESCAAAYLDPRPAAHAMHEAYSSYYTHTGPTTEPPPAGAIRTLRRALRNGFINERYGYDLRPRTRHAHALLALAPGVRGDAARLFRHVPKGARILDVGCGSGEFVAHAQRVGWRATGIDVDDQALRAGRALGYDLRTETLDEHAGGDYDAITMNHVIEHVADPVGLLAAARQRLRADGLLWIATPNLSSIGHRRFRDMWLGIDAPRHLVLLQHDALQLALARAGFGKPQDAPHTPIATDYFKLSEAIRQGRTAEGHASPDAAPLTRLLGALADWAARGNPRLGEELVVLASPSDRVREGHPPAAP